MKRHPSLEVFSRDHNVGLILGRKLLQGSSLDEGGRAEAARTLLQCWKDELADHFFEEEKLLFPLIPGIELREKLIRDHLAFSQIVAHLSKNTAEAEMLVRAGQLLTDHIRWEERVLFQAIECAATATQLEDLAVQTEQVESRRSNTTWSPRRGELMNKRKQANALDVDRTLP